MNRLMKEPFTVELSEPHSDMCDAIVAVELGDWDTPWFLSPEKVFLKNDPTGSLGIRLICNDPRCSGAVLLHGLATLAQNKLMPEED